MEERSGMNSPVRRETEKGLCMETKELIDLLKSCAEKNCAVCHDIESCVGAAWLLLKAAERLEAFEKASASGGLISRVDITGEDVEVKHFLEFEIMQTESRMREKYNNIFNGVLVGASEAKELQRKHISFCKHLLQIIDKETK